jgi:arsenate reductase (thioredoxin)
LISIFAPMTNLYSPLAQLIKNFQAGYALIPDTRKEILNQLSTFVIEKQNAGQPALLNFICTHNSRRSHISQLWAQAAACYYSKKNVHCFSGGTEATAFNPRAVKAMADIGFKIITTDSSSNPKYEVRFADAAQPVLAFSKVYNDSFNPTQNFAAIMTCSHADENCPVVIGAEKRISLPFDDPKDFDGTNQEAIKYHERVLEIGREICFAFSCIKDCH